MKPRILVIDDEAAIRDSMRMILEYEGYEFAGAATGEDGIGIVARERVDLVFLDIKMPGMDGLEALSKLKAAGDLPVVMISGHGTVATAVEATKLGAFDFIEKPLATERILLAIRNALETTRLRSENVSLRGAVELRHDIVGSSPALREVFEAVRRAAVVARAESNKIVFHSAETTLTLEARSGEVGDAHEEIPIALEGDPVEIAFNAAYLQDVLAVLDTEAIELNLGGPLSPGLLRGDGEPDYLYVVMPMQML